MNILKGGLMVYVYVEYLLLENAIINFIILYVTNKVTRTKTNKIRILIAAIVGSIYALVVFYPEFHYLTKFSVKVSVSILMIVIAYNPAKLKTFIKLLAYFYIISFIFAGTGLAVFYILKNSDLTYHKIYFINDFTSQLLIISITFSVLLIRYVFNYFNLKLNKEDVFTEVAVTLRGKKAIFTALVDTGNSLKEPISQKPVVIVEFEAIKNILPLKLQNYYMKNKGFNLDDFTNIMVELKDEIKLRFIPFKSIGKDNGILIGFKPDELDILNEKINRRITQDIVIAIYNNKMSDGEKYKGLLHPEILYKGV